MMQSSSGVAHETLEEGSQTVSSGQVCFRH